MFVSRFGAERLSPQRLDADFYRPEFLKNEEKLLAKKVGRLGDVGRFFAGPFGSLLPSNLYLDKGIPLFRVGNVGQFEILTDNLAHLAPQVHDELKTSEVLPGDLLVVKASVGEKICKVPDWIPKANITQHIIGIRPNGSFDTDYVSAFLFSSFGVLQLQRYSLGSIIQYLGITDAKGTYIVKSDTVAQKYIGDKVRQAERLRAWAKIRGESIEAIVSNDAIKSAHATIEKQHNRPQLEDLSHRLDPKYYGRRAVAVFRQAKALGKPLFSLVKGISNGFEERVFFNTGRDYITVTEVSSGRLDLSSSPKISQMAEVPDKAIIHERCALVVRTGSIGTAVKVDARDRGAVISSHLIRLEFSDEADAAAVAAYLCSPAGNVLQHKISYGAVQPQIGQDELLALPIPQFVLDAKKQILALVTEQENAIRASKSLTTTAKYLVEALIDGSLTETELIAAEQALQTGNDQLDRRVLNRLKVDGIDGEGQALFDDLDELYYLLTQAEGD